MAKRGRPLVPDEDLLHPRQQWVRPTVLHGEILDIPDPSKAEIKRWKIIEDACILAIMTQPSRANNVAPKNKVAVRFKKSDKKPIDFLRGVLKSSDDIYEIREFNAEQLLLWLYVRKLSKYCARDIYKERQGDMTSIGKMEKELEIMLDEDIIVEHNDGTEDINEEE